MLWIKLIILNLILVSSTIIGITFSKKYTYRVKELQEMKNALNIFMTKIKFTYEPIPSTFLYISEKVEGNVSKIFKNATEEMENKPAGESVFRRPRRSHPIPHPRYEPSQVFSGPHPPLP